MRVYNIYIEPGTRLSPRWWHRFIFWRSYILPWKVERTYLNSDEMNILISNKDE